MLTISADAVDQALTFPGLGQTVAPIRQRRDR